MPTNETQDEADIDATDCDLVRFEYRNESVIVECGQLRWVFPLMRELTAGERQRFKALTGLAARQRGQPEPFDPGR